MSSLSSPSGPSRSVFSQSDVSLFLNDYNREVVDPTAAPPRGLARQFQRQKTFQKYLQRGKPNRRPRPWRPLIDCVQKRRPNIAPLLPITSAFIRTVLMLYLFVTYYSLPPDAVSGEKPPRIAELYSTFPFVSCVGSIRLQTYQGLTLTMVLLTLLSTLWTWYGTKDDFVGFESRRTQLSATLVGAALSTWVVFAAGNPDRELHLVVTAAEILSIFCIRSSGMYIAHLEQKSYPALWTSGAVRFLFWWKSITLGVCLPLTIMTNVAIFGCHNATRIDIQTPGSHRYRIMAVGAPSEWFYNFTTVSWTLTIAFDIYIGPIVGKIRSEQDDAEMRRQYPERYTALPEQDEVAGMEELDQQSSPVWDGAGAQSTRNGGYDRIAMSVPFCEDADVEIAMMSQPKEMV